MSDKDFFDWFRAVAAGRDPDAPSDAQYQTPIDMRIRMKAMEHLANRRYGGVPQHISLEGDVGPTYITAEMWKQVPDEEIKVLRKTLKALTTQPIDVKTQPIDVKTQPIDVKTQPIDVKTQPIDVKTQPIDVK